MGLSSHLFQESCQSYAKALSSLPDAGAMSDEMEGKMNDFCVTLTKKRNDRSQHRRYLLKRHRVWLDEEKGIQDIL